MAHRKSADGLTLAAPQTHRTVIRSRGDGAPIGGEGNTVDPTSVALSWDEGHQAQAGPHPTYEMHGWALWCRCTTTVLQHSAAPAGTTTHSNPHTPAPTNRGTGHP